MTNCGCRRCMDERDEHYYIFGQKVPKTMTMMVVCAKCGNKRCPHANDHRHACTNSNEPGQPGSAYP